MTPIKPIWERIEKEVGPPPEKLAEVKRTPEERAEELWALWQDFTRLRLERQKAVAAKNEKKAAEVNERLEKLRLLMAERWHDSAVQEIFKKELERSIAERERLAPTYQNYAHQERLKETSEARRDELYRQIFKHREKEPDEMTLMELAELSTQIQTAKAQMSRMEKENPELAARLSFERLREYRKQLQKEGFIWTPSREEYFVKILEHLVILNQNRPLLLYGETGTGKTRLVRAVARRLTDRPPYEVGEEAKTDIRPLLGSRAIDEKGSYVTYGQLGQALTGKRTSRDEEAGKGGLFYMDEMNSYPPDALRSLIKQISGRRAGEEVTFAAWAGERESISPDFGFVGSANLPSEKHPDRPELPVEVARELASLEVDYPPQTAENPEMYEMLLAALMDQNDRIRLPKQDLAPAWKEVVDPETKTKRFELDTDPKSGGTLWRFANLVGEIQKSYKGEENALTPTEREASYFRTAVLDPGLVISWLQEYRKSALRRAIDLQTFLAEKLESWGSQKIYPEEDRNLLKKFQKAFNLEVGPRVAPAAKVRPLRLRTILSPYEIGALSPRVPRTPEYLEKVPPPLEAKIYLPDGTEVIYTPAAIGEIQPGARFVQKKDKTERPWTFKGLTAEGKAVLEAEDGEGLLLTSRKLEKDYELVKIEAEERYREMRELFKEGFLGIEEVETAFTLLDGRKLIELSKEERREALRLLEVKLNEPDIKEFLQKTPKEQLAKEWLLVLRLPKFKDGTPLTMNAMQEKIAPDMQAKGQGELFYSVDWYAKEAFYTGQTPKEMHWQFVTRKVVPETKGKNHSAQTAELKKAAQASRLDPGKTRRRLPVETLYDFVLSLRAKNQPILEAEYDWSDILSSVGVLVLVGDCTAEGAHVHRWSPEYSHERVGASLSR